jgi:uncharacterized protein (TIGR03437 family)
MSRQRLILLAKFALVVGIVPLVIYGSATGPDPFKTGDPQAPDNGATCNQASCHVGTPVNGGGGKVQIVLPGDATYVPGVAQQITVTVSDPAQRAWGFELTARALADNSQAGDLAATDASTFVQCADGSSRLPCRAGQNTQFIQHARAKTGAGSGSFTFKWTPPATAAGTIVLYVAGNAANNDGADTGDHIYTSSVQLTAAAASNGPTISANGVVPVYSTSTSVEPGSWFSIFGSNFAAGTTQWNGDFPIGLGGVSVTVNDKPAYIWFVGPTQINAQAPDDASTGTVNVVVTNAGGSATAQATLSAAGPTFSLLDASHPAGIMLTPDGSGASGGGTYDVLGPTGAFSFSTRPAKKGEIVELYGTGFGPTDPPVPAGHAFSGAAPTTTPITVTIGGISQTVTGYIVGAGLYQLNVTIPANASSGDLPLQAAAAGLQTPDGVRITVQ